MISQDDVEAALEFMRKNAQPLAKAKSERIYLEQFRKSKKAILFSQAPTTIGEGSDSRKATVADRENYAYADPEYIELLEGLRIAVEQEEHIKWKMSAAEAKVEVWRTQQANARSVDAAHR